LKRKGRYLSELVDDDAELALYVQLPGDVNMGDELPSSVLKEIAALEINLELEVFPRFGPMHGKLASLRRRGGP
jgi:hypothetical protein